MNRDEKMVSVRPVLTLLDADKKPLELFQNETLRPILKLQHELTLSLLANHKNYKLSDVSNTDRQQYQAYLIKYTQKNVDFKNQLLGVIIGLLTAIELEFYQQNRKELNKRIIQMQIQRFVDTTYPNYF